VKFADAAIDTSQELDKITERMLSKKKLSGSQKGSAMFCVTEYFAKSLKVA